MLYISKLLWAGSKHAVRTHVAMHWNRILASFFSRYEPGLCTTGAMSITTTLACCTVTLHYHTPYHVTLLLFIITHLTMVHCYPSLLHSLPLYTVTLHYHTPYHGALLPFIITHLTIIHCYPSLLHTLPWCTVTLHFYTPYHTLLPFVITHLTMLHCCSSLSFNLTMLYCCCSLCTPPYHVTL